MNDEFKVILEDGELFHFITTSSVTFGEVQITIREIIEHGNIYTPQGAD